MNMPEALVADALAKANEKIAALQDEAVKAQAEVDLLRQAWAELEAWAIRWEGQLEKHRRQP